MVTLTLLSLTQSSWFFAKLWNDTLDFLFHYAFCMTFSSLVHSVIKFSYWVKLGVLYCIHTCSSYTCTCTVDWLIRIPTCYDTYQVFKYQNKMIRWGNLLTFGTMYDNCCTYASCKCIGLMKFILKECNY